MSEMIYILSTPRSGSTLLRVMFAGHSKLFSPPELNLLPFCTMGERDYSLGNAANTVIECDQRVGLIEAVMHLTGLGPERSESWLQTWLNRNVPINVMYRVLSAMAAPRTLIDKSTLNASSLEVLRKSRWLNPQARYIHLVRHPYAVIESLQRTYLRHLAPQLSFPAAQDLWVVPNCNILCFLSEIDPRQHVRVCYEELVRDPEAVMHALCEFLGVEFESVLLEPYSGNRMTDGVRGRFQSLGDPNFLKHTRIETELSEAWKDRTLPMQVDRETRELGKQLGYDLPSPTARSKESLYPRAKESSLAGSQVVLVVPPFTYRTQAYLNAARKLGVEAICALDPDFGVPDQVTAYIRISFEQPELSAAAITNHARAHPVRAVMSIDDGGVEIAALSSRALDLPHNPMHAIRASNDKYAMRLLLERSNVPSPKFSHHWICEDPYRIADSISYPVVVKPLYLSGSRGVIRANGPDEFIAAFYRLALLLQQNGTGPDPKSFLIEEYIPGFEVSLEGVLSDGQLRPLGLYDKPDPLEGPFFEETILITPSRLPSNVQDQVVQCAEQALEAVGMRVGPIQVELRVNDNGPWVVEFAARTMGGHCSRALPFQGSFTLEELVLSHAAGLDTNHFIRAEGAHGVMMIPIPGEGIFQGVRGVENAEAVSGVSGVMITMPNGALVTPLPEGDKYMGFVFATGETPDAVEASLREAHEHLKFDLDPVTRVRLRIRPARNSWVC